MSKTRWKCLSLPWCRWLPKFVSTPEFRADWPEWADTGSKKQQYCPTCPGAAISSVLSHLGNQQRHQGSDRHFHLILGHPWVE